MQENVFTSTIPVPLIPYWHIVYMYIYMYNFVILRYLSWRRSISEANTFCYTSNIILINHLYKSTLSGPPGIVSQAGCEATRRRESPHGLPLLWYSTLCGSVNSPPCFDLSTEDFRFFFVLVVRSRQERE